MLAEEVLGQVGRTKYNSHRYSAETITAFCSLAQSGVTWIGVCLWFGIILFFFCDPLHLQFSSGDRVKAPVFSCLGP